MVTELQLDELSHLAAPFYPDTSTLGQWDSLPYHQLDGARFERLCFHLLLAEGHLPRFFGKSGQKQFGIDLICSDGLEAAVYQCKNVRKFSTAAFNEWLDTFEQLWLEEARLPVSKFVLFWPIVSTERFELESDRSDWAQRTGIAIEIVHCDILDAKLKALPALVADLFGDAAAERFCDTDSWNQGLLYPVREGLAGARPVDRYFELRASGHFISNGNQLERLEKILASNPVALVCGRAGNGKTLAAIDLALRANRANRPVYFAHDWEDASTDLLVEGIKARAFRPIIVVIDDIGDHVDRVSRVVRRCLAANGHNVQFVLSATLVPSDIGTVTLPDDGFLEDLISRRNFLQPNPDRRFIRRLISVTHALGSNLTDDHLETIEAATGNDLVLLDQYLSFGSFEHDQVPPNLDGFLAQVLKRYFGASVVEAREFQNIAAVAQFGLGIPVSWCADRSEILTSRAGKLLLAQSGAPATFRFRHSSLGELVCRALSKAHADPSLEESIAGATIAYLCRIDDERGSAEPEMLAVIQNRLRLTQNLPLKREIFRAEQIVERVVTSPSSTSLALLAAILRLYGSAPCPAAYIAALRERVLTILLDSDAASRAEVGLLPSILRILPNLDDPAFEALLTATTAPNWAHVLATKGDFETLLRFVQIAPRNLAKATLTCFGQGDLRSILCAANNSSESLAVADHIIRKLVRSGGTDIRSALEALIAPSDFIALLKAKGSIIELLKFYACFSQEYALLLAAEVEQRTLRALVTAAIEQRRSLGTINMPMRELRLRSEQAGDGAGPEAAIDAGDLLRLIEANGTYVCLLAILRDSSPTVSARILTELNVQLIQRLVTRTIITRRSIGTLHYAFRVLATRDAGCGQTQREAIEQKTPLADMYRLLLANGDLMDLARLASGCSLSYAYDLMANLTRESIELLCECTVGSGRRIGTLHLHLKAVSASEPSASSADLSKFEELLGVDRLMRLELSNGNILDLISVVQYCSRPFADQLINNLNKAVVTALVRNAVSQERSAGSLHRGWRQLAALRLPNGRDYRRILEANTDPRLLVALMLGRNAIVDFLKLVAASSETFADSLVANLDRNAADILIDRMIASGRSAGTFNMPLKEISEWIRPDGSSLQAYLEMMIGAPALLRIIAAQGSLFELFVMLRDATPETSAAIIDCLDEALVDALVDKTIHIGRSIGVLNMTFKELATRKLPDGREQRQVVEGLLGPRRLLRLIVELGSIVDFLYIVADGSSSLSASVLDHVTKKQIHDLVNVAIAEGRPIGALNFAFKKLGGRQGPSGKDLRSEVEDMLGARNLVRLIVHNGEIVSLFSILHDLSPDGADRLVGVISDADIEALIEKAVKVGRSVGSMHFTIHRLRSKTPRTYGRLNKLIGSKSWWRVIGGCADLTAIGELLECQTRSFREEMLDDGAALTQQEWTSLVARSGFFQSCEAMRSSWAMAPSITQITLRRTIHQEAAGLAEAASWREIANGLDILDGDPPDDLRSTLQKLAYDRLTAADLGLLNALPLLEIASLARAIQLHQPDRLPEVARALKGLHVEAADWTNAYATLGETSCLMDVAPSLSPQLANDILDSSAQLKVKGLKEASSRDLRNFLWRRFALFVDCGHNSDGNFEADQTEKFWNSLVALLKTRLRYLDRREDHLEHVALGGAMALLAPAMRPEVSSILKSGIRNPTAIEREIDDQAQSFGLTFFLEQACAAAQGRFESRTPIAWRPSLDRTIWNAERDFYLSRLRAGLILLSALPE